MGAAGPRGVEIRATSLRVTFTLGGKQHRETVMVNGEPLAPTPRNIKYAANLAAEIRERIKHDTFSMVEYFPASGAGAAQMTLGAQLDTWLAAQRITPSTKAGYNGCIRFWKKHLDAMPLRTLRLSHILTALASAPNLSGKTVNNRVSVLREALALAVDDKLMADNPAEKVKRAAYQKPEVDPFTAEEAEAIIADMRKHYDPQIANYTEFKFFSGVRTGESFGLKWPDVDLAGKLMVVHESVVIGLDKDTTKTSRARRVKLNSRALAALQAQRKHTFIRGTHVFVDPRDGERWDGEQTYRYFWVPTLKRLKMRYRPPYNTRHTYATMMLMAGIKPAFCAGQMGHSVQMFLDTYAKWIPGAGDDIEMEKLERQIAPGKGKTA